MMSPSQTDSIECEAIIDRYAGARKAWFRFTPKDPAALDAHLQEVDSWVADAASGSDQGDDGA